MSYKLTKANEKLRLGIEAIRAGQHEVAREQLGAVLEEDRDNIPAMLWLAFVAPSPQESLRLLRQVLALDPENERAQAGIRWAQKRLEKQAASSDDAPTLRRQLLQDSEAQKQAQKGVLAQRARRTINPLIAMIIVTGALGLLAIGAGALFFLPPETLAAWLPAPIQLTGTVPVAPAAAGDKPAGPVENFAADTVDLTGSREQGDLTAAQPAETGGTTQELQDAAWVEPGDPPFLIGPVVASSSNQPAPVDEAILAHQPAYLGEKWIEVNVTTQQVTAWEGNVPVMSFVASTGLASTPTILGKYPIYWKLESTLMIGPNYYLPDVPYTMYFQGGYALHGTYWHSNFGQPMSHGCVNLSNDDAKKLFEWADPVIPEGYTQVTATTDNPGTLVVVHE